MSEIREKILHIESQLDLGSYRYKGENVWPIIRIAIYLSSTKSSSNNVRFIESLKFFVSGGLEFAKRKILDIASSNHDIALVTSSHYKVLENGKIFDRIIDPVINLLNEKNISYNVWEFTGNFHFDKSINYRAFLRPIQKEIYFASKINRFARVAKRQPLLEGDVVKLNTLLRNNGIQFQINQVFLTKLRAIFFQADYFYRALQRHQVKRLLVVCYYDVKCFSAILAANRLKIPCIDLQHGVQGVKHLAYASWPESISNESRFLPSHFFVWDEISGNTILRWKKSAEHVLLGCNKWVKDRVRRLSNDIILVTLQPLEDYLPDSLIELMKNYEGKKQWYVRLHPRQHAEISLVQKRLYEAGLTQRVNVIDASKLPLTSLLEQCVLHVTFYSSVVIEASYYGIPTYFLKEENVSFYKDYLLDDQIFYFPKHQIENVIESLEQKKTDSSIEKNDCLAALDKFLHVSR